MNGMNSWLDTLVWKPLGKPCLWETNLFSTLIFLRVIWERADPAISFAEVIVLLHVYEVKITVLLCKWTITFPLNTVK